MDIWYVLFASMTGVSPPFHLRSLGRDNTVAVDPESNLKIYSYDLVPSFEANVIDNSVTSPQICIVLGVIANVVSDVP